MKNIKTFEEHSNVDYLDITHFTIDNVDILDIGPGYKFYRANNVQEAQEILKIWPDIKLPLYRADLLQHYIKAGRIFLFYVTRSKKEFFFADSYAGHLGPIHDADYNVLNISNVPEPAKSLFLEYKNLS